MNYLLLAGLTLALATTVLAQPNNTMPRQPVAIVPWPNKIVLTGETCEVSRDWKIVVERGNAQARSVASQLASVINRTTTFDLHVDETDAPVPGKKEILITSKGAIENLGDEGYALEVAHEGILITASTPAGMFYASQSLLQLYRDEIFGSTQQIEKNRSDWAIPTCRIEDSPWFKWRGLMLDVSRHFLDKDEVKQFIDVMAMNKLNVLHWHLVDDQGWRIEIKKYPKLTEVGAWRNGIGFGLKEGDSKHYRADGKYGGFYTQDDIREVVAYAKSMHITVVPEIEMPGHSSAVLTAYPEFSCEGKPFDPNVSGGVFHGVFCAGNEQTYTFLQNILTEVMELFPGTFVHVGGDEVPKDNWKKCEKCQSLKSRYELKNEDELQSHFIKRMEKFISGKGRRLIGWDEILDGGLAPGATVMSWRGIKGGIAAANAGHDCVMSPGTHCYLDHAQATNGEPRNIGGFTSLAKAYSYEPIPEEVAADKRHHILGVQGNLWAEYFPNVAQVQYMAFPRACALAEVGWTDPKLKNFDDFKARMMVHTRRLNHVGMNYRAINPDGFDQPFDSSGDGGVKIREFFPGGDIRYTLDGTRPNEQSELYTGPIRISGLRTLYARWKDPARNETHFADAPILGSPPARVSASRGAHRDHLLYQAFDGDEQTYYQSAERVTTNDELRISLLVPTLLKSIRIVTGTNATAKNGVHDGGVIEVTTDGENWTKAATFSGNVAEATLPDKLLKAIRVRVTADQKTVLVIRDVVLK